jgi:hypothetical protein
MVGEASVADRKSVVQVKFRLRREVLKQLERSAKAGDRSVNEEIQRRLEQSIQQEEQQGLLEKAAKRALDLFAQERGLGLPYSVFQNALATEAQPTETTDTDETVIAKGNLRVAGMPRRDEAKAEPPTPADGDEKDKAS